MQVSVLKYVLLQTHTCPGEDGFFAGIQLQVKAHNRSKDEERPDRQLEQVTGPRPQLGV